MIRVSTSFTEKKKIINVLFTLTSWIGCLHPAQISENFCKKHSEHTGLPFFSLNVALAMGFSHTWQTKCSGCHDLPNAVKICKLKKKKINR